MPHSLDISLRWLPEFLLDFSPSKMQMSSQKVWRSCYFLLTVQITVMSSSNAPVRCLGEGQVRSLQTKLMPFR